jgi:ATP-dependent RNA helicase DDX35
VILQQTLPAETSVTVPRDHPCNLDSISVKLSYFDPKTDFERLIVVPISQASAQQRAGRAGRLHFNNATDRCLQKIHVGKWIKDSTRNITNHLTSFISDLGPWELIASLAFDMMDLPEWDALHGLSHCMHWGDRMTRQIYNAWFGYVGIPY